MAGGHERHLEEFGMCQCNDRSGVEMMRFEFERERRPGTYYWEEVPACADCFGLL